MGVIVHSAQSVFFAFLILGVVPGLAWARGADGRAGSEASDIVGQQAMQ